MKQSWSPVFGHDDVEILDRQPVYKGFFRMDKLRIRHKTFAGDTMTISRELFVRGEAVCLLPYDPVLDQVVMIEQFRVGALDHPNGPWLLELVAGIVEEGETAEDLCIREAEEEAGLTVGQLELVSRYMVSPGGNSEHIQILCGQVDSANAGGDYGLAHEGEDIRVHVFSAETCFQMLADGVIDNAASVIGLLWLQLNRERLRQAWTA